MEDSSDPDLIRATNAYEKAVSSEIETGVRTRYNDMLATIASQ
jgi:hypothetical protein